ncbi:MAG: DUF4417 domain-containing protein [Bacilli bacterium]
MFRRIIIFEKTKNNNEYRIINVFKSDLVKEARFSEKYEFPIIKRTNFKPKKAVPFGEIRNKKIVQTETWVHFYMHDYKFERLWNNPSRYLPILKSFKGVITTDFSIYRNMPISIQIWNTYRNRALSYYLQSNGVDIIPNVRWGDERTYEFAFEGLEKGGTFAVSTNGCIRNKLDRYYFEKGFKKMVEILEPSVIVVYSSMPDDIFLFCKEQGIQLINLENWHSSFKKEVC